MHLVFYDGECGFCDLVVQFLLKQDKKHIFMFAPLQGTTASSLLQDLPLEVRNADSVILIENYRTHPQVLLYGKAGLRILWLLGGMWALPGSLSFLPSFLYDWGYRLVARNRKRLFPLSCVVPDPQDRDRFLP